MEVKVSQLCLSLCDPHRLYSPWNSPGQNSGVGSLSLRQGIFSTQSSNLGLLRGRQILYQLSHKGSPKILEWVAYPFSRGSSWPRGQTGVCCIAGRFFTNWAMREAMGAKGVKFNVVVQLLSCVTLCDPMDCSRPGFPIFHYLPEFAQIHVHWVGDAI